MAITVIIDCKNLELVGGAIVERIDLDGVSVRGCGEKLNIG